MYTSSSSESSFLGSLLLQLSLLLLLLLLLLLVLLLLQTTTLAVDGLLAGKQHEQCANEIWPSETKNQKFPLPVPLLVLLPPPPLSPTPCRSLSLHKLDVHVRCICSKHCVELWWNNIYAPEIGFVHGPPDRHSILDPAILHLTPPLPPKSVVHFCSHWRKGIGCTRLCGHTCKSGAGRGCLPQMERSVMPPGRLSWETRGCCSKSLWSIGRRC